MILIIQCTYFQLLENGRFGLQALLTVEDDVNYCTCRQLL
mgnify:CR=1 FL=1